MGSPSRQASKDGEASRLLSAIIRAWRSLRGYTLSRESAPSLSKGGSATAGTRLSRVRPLPWRQACSMSVERRMYSRDWSGSAWMRTRPRRPETMPAISSRRSSSADSKGTSGAASDCITLRPTPAADPGV